MSKKGLTVKEVAEQLARLVELGFGEYNLEYLDDMDMARPIENGIHWIDGNEDYKFVWFY